MAAIGARPSDHFTTTAGITARYFDEGSGPAVLLLHGGALGSSADVFERNLGPLAALGLRPIAVDLPGSGGTGDPLEYTEGYRRRFLIELLDALGIERAGIVGHSASGGPTVSLALDRPDRITRIMILGTQSLLPPPPSDGPAAGPDIHGERPTGAPTIDDVRAVLLEQLYDHALITPEALAPRLRWAAPRPNTPVQGRLQADRAAERDRGTPLWQRLDQLPVPICLLYGANDRPNTLVRFALLRERYPTLDLTLLERCRHLIQWDRADAFVAKAGQFFGTS